MSTKYEYRLEIPRSIKIQIDRESESGPDSERATIFKVPNSLRRRNPSSYTPRIISIGPLHKDDPRLQPMEDHKMTFMYRLFCRIAKSTKKDTEETSVSCVKEIFNVVTRARACYAQSFTNYDDKKFAEMMVIDGCFILELLYRFQQNGESEGGPIFDHIQVMQDVKHDLLLLENQMPFFILDILFNITLKKVLKPSTLLTDLVLYFFDDVKIFQKSEITPDDIGKIINHFHIFGILRSVAFWPKASMPMPKPTTQYSATDIAASRVTFKEYENEKSPLEVKFNRTPLLHQGLGDLICINATFGIRPFLITNYTWTMLRNCIAFEECYQLSRHYATSLLLSSSSS